MKKHLKNLLSLTVVASLAFLFSCGDDAETIVTPNPSVTVTAEIDDETLASGGTVEIGQTIDFTVSVVAPGGFSEAISALEVRRGDAVIGNYKDALTVTQDANGADVATGTFSISPVTEVPPATFTFDFVVTDDLAQTDSSTSFTFDLVAPPANVTTYQTVLLGSQGNNNPSFYNALENVRYSYAQSSGNAANIDFVYYWGDSNNNTLAAPDDDGLAAVFNSVNLPLNLGVENTTRFSDTNWTAAEFDAISNNDELEDAASFEAGGLSSSTNLSENQVIAFQLDNARGGAFGLIKIEDISDTNGTGTITIDVKIPGAE